MIWRLSVSTTLWVKFGKTSVEEFCLETFFLFYYFTETKSLHRCVLQRILLTNCILIVFSLFFWFLIAFYWSFNICIYCSYDNLYLLALIARIWIIIYSCRWLLKYAAEILLDFNKTYYHFFTKTLKCWSFLWFYL